MTFASRSRIIANSSIISTIPTLTINFGKLVGLHSWTNDWWATVNHHIKKKVPTAKTNIINALQEGTKLPKKWCNAGIEWIYLLKNHKGCFICGIQPFTTCPAKKHPSADNMTNNSNINYIECSNFGKLVYTVFCHRPSFNKPIN